MGYLNIIKWLTQRQISPTRYGATAAEILERRDMVNFLTQNKFILILQWIILTSIEE
jgi:hypothetical protein